MNELPPDVKSLLERGDPANDVTPQLVARVSARLNEAPRTRSWRPVVLVVALITSIALGAGGTMVVTRLTRTEQPTPPQPIKINTTSPDEAALLQSALEALARHELARALKQLDAHDARFPSGELTIESRVTRARVLLELKDGDGAAKIFEQLRERDLTPALRLEWVRVLVKRGDCARATEVSAPLSPELIGTELAGCVQGSAP